jgi:hypothetical protein
LSAPRPLNTDAFFQERAARCTQTPGSTAVQAPETDPIVSVRAFPQPSVTHPVNDSAKHTVCAILCTVMRNLSWYAVEKIF